MLSSQLYISMERLKRLKAPLNVHCASSIETCACAEGAVTIDSELRIALSNTAPKLKQKHNSLLRCAARAATSFAAVIAYTRATLNYTA
jgi:hypothetical protein